MNRIILKSLAALFLFSSISMSTPARAEAETQVHLHIPAVSQQASNTGVRQKSTVTYHRSRAPGVGSGRPSGCPPRVWCGCWLSLEIFGENRRELWLAKNWLKFGKTVPRVGSIAVLGRRGGGHVGVVVGFDGSDPILKSGNHSNRVAVATYTRSRVIAFVSPS